MYMYILAFSCSGYTLIYLAPPQFEMVVSDSLKLTDACRMVYYNKR